MAQPDVMKLLEKEQGKAPRLSTQEIVQESLRRTGEEDQFEDLYGRMQSALKTPQFRIMRSGNTLLFYKIVTPKDTVEFDILTADSPKELLNMIEQKTQKSITSVTKEQKQFFEKAMIERVASLIEPEDRAVTYMAVMYRRMTPEMFHFLTQIPLNECREILLEKLKPLSFIKYKKGDIVLLHDEMRRLIVEYWWNEHDAAR